MEGYEQAAESKSALGKAALGGEKKEKAAESDGASSGEQERRAVNKQCWDGSADGKSEIVAMEQAT